MVLTAAQITAAASTTNLAPGEPVTLTVQGPPSTQVDAANPLAGIVPVVVSVTWTYNDGSKSLGAGDLLFLAGDAKTLVSTVVFRPAAATRTITVTATIRVAAGSTAPLEITRSIPITQVGLNPDGHTDRIAGLVGDLVKQVLRIEIVDAVVAPGAVATARIVPAPGQLPPGVVTQLAQADPTVRIRGAIPLGPVIEALTAPLFSALGNVVAQAVDAVPALSNAVSPGVAQAVREVGELLGEPLSVPLALDVTTESVVRTVVPASPTAVTGAVEIDFLTGAAPRGVLPLGSWPLAFAVTSVSWVCDGECDGEVYTQPTGGGGAVASLVPVPSVRIIGAGDVTGVRTASVAPNLLVSVPDLAAGEIAVDLPGVAITSLPIDLPNTVVAFNTPALYSNPNPAVVPPKAAICLTEQLVASMPNASAAVTLLATANAAVQGFITTADAVSGRLWRGTEEAGRLLDLGTALGHVVRLLSLCPPCSVLLVPPEPPHFPIPNQPAPPPPEVLPVFNLGDSAAQRHDAVVGMENAVRSLFSFGPNGGSHAVFCEGDVDPNGSYVTLREIGGYAAALLTTQVSSGYLYCSLPVANVGNVRVVGAEGKSGFYETIYITEAPPA